MNISKPTETDINKAFELLNALDLLSEGFNPFIKIEDEDELQTYSTWLKHEDKEDALDSIINLYDNCNIQFLLTALSALISHENGIINQESRILEINPEIKKSEKDSKRLDWLEKKMAEDGYPVTQHNGYGFTNEYPDETHSFESLREAIDDGILKECQASQN